MLLFFLYVMPWQIISENVLSTGQWVGGDWVPRYCDGHRVHRQRRRCLLLCGVSHQVLTRMLNGTYNIYICSYSFVIIQLFSDYRQCKGFKGTVSREKYRFRPKQWSENCFIFILFFRFLIREPWFIKCHLLKRHSILVTLSLEKIRSYSRNRKRYFITLLSLIFFLGF